MPVHAQEVRRRQGGHVRSSGSRSPCSPVFAASRIPDQSDVQLEGRIAGFTVPTSTAITGA